MKLCDAKALTVTRFKWLKPHFLNPCLQPPIEGLSMKAVKAHDSDCDLWLRLWLSCASVEVDLEKVRNCQSHLGCSNLDFGQVV